MARLVSLGRSSYVCQRHISMAMREVDPDTALAPEKL